MSITPCPNCGYCGEEKRETFLIYGQTESVFDSIQASTASFTLSSSFVSNVSYAYDFCRAMRIAEIRKGFQAFLEWLSPTDIHPNPLPILARAVNVLRLRFRPLRQPCWRKGRWKAR